MTAVDINMILSKAIDYAIQAGEMIKAASEESISFLTKENSADLVTKTDKAVEIMLFSRIAADFPSHILIGEESAEPVGKLSDVPTWIVDPVDGTTNFVHGFPFYCVSIGVAINQIPSVGVIFNPITGMLYYGSIGNGSYLKKGPISTILQSPEFKLGSRAQPLPNSLSDALLATEYGASKSVSVLHPKLEIIKRYIAEPKCGRGIRSIGSAALTMCLVAQGAVDIYYEAGTHAWDVCAGAIILTEAGGIVRGWSQKEFDVLDRALVCCRPGGEIGQPEPNLVKELVSLLVPISYPRD